jgi:hypothetical protein
VVVKAADYLAAMQTLRDDPTLAFEEMIDLCGVDYLNYGEGTWDGLRFAVVVHLLSIEHNWRVRVRVFCPDDDMPLVQSITGDLAQRQLVRARSVRPVRHPVRRPRRPAPHPDRLRLHRPPVPQGLPDFGLCRDALRPRAEARDLPTRDDRAA